MVANNTKLRLVSTVTASASYGPCRCSGRRPCVFSKRAQVPCESRAVSLQHASSFCQKITGSCSRCDLACFVVSVSWPFDAAAGWPVGIDRQTRASCWTALGSSRCFGVVLGEPLIVGLGFVKCNYRFSHAVRVLCDVRSVLSCSRARVVTVTAPNLLEFALCI